MVDSKQTAAEGHVTHVREPGRGRGGQQCRRNQRGGHGVHSGGPEAEITHCAQGTAGTRAGRGTDTARKPGPVGWSHATCSQVAGTGSPEQSEDKGVTFSKSSCIFKIQVDVRWGQGQGDQLSNKAHRKYRDFTG